ncbi:DUF2934 domain-containing protein [Thiobacillus sp.]
MTEETIHANVADQTIHQHDAEQDHQTRNEWISTYAYFLAAARGFTPAAVLDDWLNAERAYMEKGLAKGESD